MQLFSAALLLPECQTMLWLLLSVEAELATRLIPLCVFGLLLVTKHEQLDTHMASCFRNVSNSTEYSLLGAQLCCIMNAWPCAAGHIRSRQPWGKLGF